MSQGRYTEKILLSIGLILIFASSSIEHIEAFEILIEYLFHIGGVLVIIGALRSLNHTKNKLTPTFKTFTFLYGSFISLAIVSMIVNQTFKIDFWSLEKFFLIYLFLVVFLTLSELISKQLIINALIISLTILFAYFLIVYPLSEMDSNAYRGAYDNPSYLGILAATLFSVSFVAGMGLFQAKQHYLLATLYLLISIVPVYLVIISNSRTSFITIAIVFAIIAITYIYDVLNKRNLLSWKSVLLVIVIAFGGISLFVLIDNPVYEALKFNILDKFIRKIEVGSLTSGRIAIWQPIIEGAGLFGRGPDYFEGLSGLHAHNSFLHILSVYGWLAAITYVIFWLLLLIKSIQYYLIGKFTETYALLPLILVFNYISLSMMENVSIHVSSFVAITMVAILSKPKTSSLMINR